MAAVASPKEAEFLEYLVKSNAAEELIKVLVGLEESTAKPEDPVKFLEQKFASQVQLACGPATHAGRGQRSSRCRCCRRSLPT